MKVSVSGVRGVVGESLTPQLAARFASAFGTYVGRGKVVVARDARPSGPMIKNAVIAGLLATGCQPVDFGVAPIPSALVFTETSQSAGGVAVTASHNPPEWNGLKFIGPRGLYLNPSQVEEFLDIYHQGEFSFVPADKYKKMTAEPDPLEPHLSKLLKALNVGMIRERKLKVVADCCNGAGAVLMPAFLEALGCRAVLINARPDGAFVRDSEPVPENLTEVCRAVVEEKADVGFAQDADADRLAIIDERGVPLGEELTLALAVKHVLAKTPGPVAANVSTTRAVDDIAQAAGVPAFRTKIGEINVVEEVIQRNAVIGGEGNGGVIWPRVHACRDSFSAAGLVLEMMAASGKKISELRDEIPFYVMLKDKVEATSEEAHRIVGDLRRRYAGENINTLDGLKIQFAGSSVHLRPSNTEPVIRIMAEATTREEAVRLLAAFKKDILQHKG